MIGSGDGLHQKWSALNDQGAVLVNHCERESFPKDKVPAWLDKAAEEDDQPVGFIKTVHVWDSIRPGPRYTAVLKKIRLEPWTDEVKGMEDMR